MSSLGTFLSMCFIVPHLSFSLCVLYLRVVVYNELVPWHRQITHLVRAAVCHGGGCGQHCETTGPVLGLGIGALEKPLCHPLSTLCSTPGSLMMEASLSRVPILPGPWPVLTAVCCIVASRPPLSHKDLPQSSWVLHQCCRERALSCGGGCTGTMRAEAWE